MLCIQAELCSAYTYAYVDHMGQQECAHTHVSASKQLHSMTDRDSFHCCRPKVRLLRKVLRTRGLSTIVHDSVEQLEGVKEDALCFSAV